MKGLNLKDTAFLAHGSGLVLKHLVASFSGGSLINSTTDQRGVFFSPNSTITAYQLGRYVNTGNNQVHSISIYDDSSTFYGSVSVNLSGGTVGTYVYGTLSSPITMIGGTRYYVVSSEINGLDNWLLNATLTINADFNGASYGSAGVFGGSVAIEDSGLIYGPVDMLYA